MSSMASKVIVRSFTDDATQQVTVQIEVDGAALAHAIFDAPEFDQLIRQLSDERMKLSDEIPLRVDPGTRLETVMDPAWHMPDDNPPETKRLVLRHPGLGWIGFSFPDKEAAEIARRLSAPPLPQNVKRAS